MPFTSWWTSPNCSRFAQAQVDLDLLLCRTGVAPIPLMIVAVDAPSGMLGHCPGLEMLSEFAAVDGTLVSIDAHCVAKAVEVLLLQLFRTRKMLRP